MVGQIGLQPVLLISMGDRTIFFGHLPEIHHNILDPPMRPFDLL